MINRTQRADRMLTIPSGIQAGTPLAALFMLLFVLSPAAPAQTFSLLYQFKSGLGGINPNAGVVLDATGNLYGTTLNDGAFASGTVFQLSPSGKHRVLYSFTGSGGDGAFPYYGSLSRDSSGNLYGTTQQGGIYSQACPFGCGTVFKVDASGKETVLYRFTGTGGDGNLPYFGLVRDSSGNLYGTTFLGGADGVGTVFKVDPTGKETVLYSFSDSIDGGLPFAGLLLDSKGNVYGTTGSGGASFFGTVFGISSAGQEKVLYSFNQPPDGFSPAAGLIRDSAGNFYGTTGSGGASAFGTVFKVTPSGQ
jgi:uncharacterized repeat protein (TIGR03803 family)